MNILGIDPSLTSLGYAYCIGGEVRTGVVKARSSGFHRITSIVDTVCAILEESSPELVVLEGYSMGRIQGKLFERAELVGNLKFSFWSRRIPTLVVPPTSLKLFATGSGRADKVDMKREMARHRGRLFATDDEADAYALMLFGEAFKNPRQRPRDSRHYKRAALRSGVLLT